MLNGSSDCESLVTTAEGLGRSVQRLLTGKQIRETGGVQ